MQLEHHPEDATAARSPRVRIAMPTRNRVGLLRGALASALAQTYANLEIIVSNNASTDGTAEFLAGISDSRVTVVTQPEMVPVTQNFNACIRHGAEAGIEAEYMLLLSDDDLIEPRAIEAMVAAYERQYPGRGAPGVVYASGWFIDAEGAITQEMMLSPEVESALELVDAFFKGQRDILLCGILYRMSEMPEGFPAHFPVAADSAVWIRSVARYGFAVCVQERLVKYRRHASETITMPISRWVPDIVQLGELAIEELDVARVLDNATRDRIRRNVTRINARFIVRKVRGTREIGRWAKLSELLRHISVFANPTGLPILAKGIARVLFR